MSQDSDRIVLREDNDGVAVLTLNRPASRNAFNGKLKKYLLEALDGVSADTGIRAVVLTGAGRAFSAGGDIKEMPERLAAPQGEIGFRGWARLKANQQLVLALHRMEKPVIAAVNGPAAGLGLDIALACDFILAAKAADFRMSFILRGLVPDGGGAYFLPRRIGLARAKMMIFSGEALDAERALAIGLADRVAADATLLSEATAWAADLGSKPVAALALAKSLLNTSFETTLEQSFAASNQAQAICYTTSDHRSLVEGFMRDRTKT